MRVASAQALTDAQRHVVTTAEHESYDVLRLIGDEFLSIGDIIRHSPKLAEALTSTIRSQADKYALIDRLVASDHVDNSATTAPTDDASSTKSSSVVHPVVVDVMKLLSDESWSQSSQMSHTLEELGIFTLLCAAKKRDELDTIQRELFSVDSVLHTQRQLRHALTSLSRALDERLRLVDNVFGSTVSELTLVLLKRIILRTQSGRLLAALRELRMTTADAQGKELAVVQVAHPLTSEQHSRLETILERQCGRPVHIDTEIDPSLIGGLRIRMGADLYEGTLLASLQQVKARLA